MAVLSSDGKKILNNYDRFTGVPFNATKYPALPSGVVVDNAVWFNNPKFGGGYAKRDYEFDASVIWFGAKHDYDTVTKTGTDNSASIQKGIDYLFSNGGGVLYLPKGNYMINTKIVMKFGVTLKGEVSVRHDAYSPFSEILASTTFNGTMIEFSYANNGGPTVYSGLSNGATATSQTGRLTNLKIGGGDRDNKTLKRLSIHGAWSIEIDHCTIVGTKLISFSIEESNTLSIHDNTFGGCLFINGMRDSHIYKNEISGFGVSNGTMARTGFWLTGYRSIGNIIVGNLIYNSSANIARPEFTLAFTSSADTNELTTSSANIFPDLTPVVLTGSILGGGLSENPTYWIKITGTNKFTLHKTPTAAINGTGVVDIFSNGTGQIACGRETNFLYNGDASNTLNRHFNVISNNRFDQSYGTGAELRGINGTTFTSNTIITSGFANPVGQAGLVLKDSYDNNLAGTVIDGSIYTGGLDSSTSNQTIGVIYNMKNDFSGLIVKNHTDVDFWNIGSSFTSRFSEYQYTNNSFKNVSNVLDNGNYITTRQRNGGNAEMQFFSASNLAATLLGSSNGTNNNLTVVFPGTSPTSSLIIGAGTWNGGHARLGTLRLWKDANGNLRIKNGSAPVSDTDGDSLMKKPIIDTTDVILNRTALNAKYPTATIGDTVIQDAALTTYRKKDDSPTGTWSILRTAALGAGTELQIPASANNAVDTSANAAGATPTSAEFNALRKLVLDVLTENRDLKTKMRNVGILAA
jgi:hypothetical protein